MNESLTRVRHFLASDIFTAILFLLAGIVIIFDFEVPGTICFAFIIAAVLIISDDIVSCFTPFFLVVPFAIRCKDTFDEFMTYKWAVPILVFAVVFHAVAYRKAFTFRKGKLLLPMIIAAAATTLGGVGIITVKEYFSIRALLYVFALGFGVVLIYILFSSIIAPGKNYTEHMDERISKLMIAMTLFLFFAVIQWYVEYIDKFLANPGILAFQWRNNACTLLMIALPFTFYMATKKFPYIIFSFLSMGTMLMTGSRGGLVFGGIEFIILIIYFAIVDKKHRKILLGIVAAIAIVALCLTPKLIDLFQYTIERFASQKENWRRIGLWLRSIDDFCANPITGRGLGYMGNRDIHPSKIASLCWYHSSLPQVIGSFGLIGVGAYGYQMFCRIKFFIGEKSLFAKTVFLSFIGLELMSLVNPGIFAPLYLIIITVFFVIVEQYHFPSTANEQDLKISNEKK